MGRRRSTTGNKPTRALSLRQLRQELHDNIGQLLFGVCLQLHSAQEAAKAHLGPRGLPELQAAIKACGNLMVELRRLSHGDPAPPPDGPLPAMLRQAARTHAGCVKVAVHCDAPAKSLELRPAVKLALFRIAQEALCNAARHSRAKKVSIGLGYRHGRLLLRVQDDGVGFSPATPAASAQAPGQGLRNMQERAQALGGQFTVASRPGRTVVGVEVAVPLGLC